MSIEALEKKLAFARENPTVFDPIPVLDRGFVRLVDWLGDDSRIVQSARVSYGEGTKTVREDAALIDYLIRHKHTSPLEQVIFTFHIKLPLFVFAQLVRHRTASLNSQSARYSVMKEEFYIPTVIRSQSGTNKQGSDGLIDNQEFAIDIIEEASETGYADYEGLLELGAARELSRIVLPQNLYTEIYWTQDLHNLFHLLKLRLDAHAQYEIQVYAEAIHRIVSQVVPAAVDSWLEHNLNSVHLSNLEAAILKNVLSGSSTLEDAITEGTKGLSKGYVREIREKLTGLNG